MKPFEELTAEEKEILIDKCVNSDIEGLDFKDLYEIAYNTRIREYQEDEELLKEAYSYLEDEEETDEK